MKRVVGSVLLLLVLFFGCELGESTEKKASFEERFAVSKSRADALFRDGTTAIADPFYRGFRKINNNNFYFFLENGVVVSFTIIDNTTSQVRRRQSFIFRKADSFDEYSVKIKYNGQEITEVNKNEGLKDISYNEIDNPSNLLKEFGQHIETIKNAKLYDENNAVIDFGIELEIIEN